METDFVAFYRTFKERGIASEYWCLEDLDTTMTEYGDLIYGRDDLDNAMRTVVLSKGDEKFYIVQPSVKEMKRGICSWLRTAVASSSKDDHILLILISHGTSDGSVLIGGEKQTTPAEYLTSLEIKHSARNLHRNSSLTVVNTCCYSGGWTNITKEGQGRRYVAAAASASRTAENFLTQSGRYRGGLFATAFLECLKRDSEGLLSQFTAEVKAEVASYKNPRTLQPPAASPVSAVSRTAHWNKPLSAFIPIQNNSNFQQTVADTIADVQSTNLHDLFKAIKPARKRKKVPDEVSIEIDHYRLLSMKRGGANGEDQLHEACRVLLEADANETTLANFERTVAFREKCRLDAERLSRVLEVSGIIDTNFIDLSEEALTPQSRGIYRRVFSGTRLVDLAKLPPEGCYGGMWENPFTWLSNNIAAQENPVNMSNLQMAVNEFITDSVMAQHGGEARGI